MLYSHADIFTTIFHVPMTLTSILPRGSTSTLLRIEEIELVKKFSHIFFGKRGNTLQDYGTKEIFFYYITSTVEIHGGIGFLRTSENVSQLLSQS
jgi:hypothetical protein